MSNVIKLYPRNAADKPDNVLELAQGNYDSVVILGYDHNGELDVRASLNINAAEILFMIESFKKKLLDGDYYDGE